MATTISYSATPGTTDLLAVVEEGKLEANEGKLKEYDTAEEIWKNMQVAED